MEPFKLQLAIQGGGAKIVSLLAALEAVQELEKKNLIRVTRIAGTSAGAIAGALFASEIPMEAVRRELIAFRKKIHRLPRPTRFRLLTTVVLANTPMASTNEIVRLLHSFFGHMRIRDLNDKRKGQLLIVSADLSTGAPHIAADNESVIDALLDSSAIPLYFRLWNNARGSIADGGICENLAADILRDKEDAFGPIVALSFDRSRTENLTGLHGYLLALLNTAIDNSVERARQQLGAASVCRLNSDPHVPSIGTFDFDRALDPEIGLGYAYVSTKKLTTEWLTDFVNLERAKGKTPVDEGLWELQNLTILRQLGQVYTTQHEPVKYEVRRSVLFVQANCLLSSQDTLAGTPDLLKHQLSFSVGDEPIHCIRMGLMMAEGSKSRGQASVSVVGPNGEIAPIVLPMRTEDSIKYPGRELAVFFDPILPRQSGPYTVTLQQWIVDAMIRLKQGESDDLYLTQHRRAKDKIRRIELVILVPKDRRSFFLKAKRNETNSGRLMTAGELSGYDTGGPSFRPYGWCIDEADPHSGFGVDLSWEPL